MNAAERRDEIKSILIAERKMTAAELAIKFGVTVRTIENDIQALSLLYPIYTKPGVGGGVFMSEDYNPYINSLSRNELQTLKEIYQIVDSRYKATLLQIMRKYGPAKLEV